MSVEHSPVRRGVTPPGGPSTFDLLHWSDVPRENQVRTPVRISATNDSKAFAALAADPSCTDSPLGRPTIRMHQPAGGVSSIAFGEKLSSEEEEALVKRRPGSESKRKEMSGSGIFSAEDAAEDGEPANGVHTPVKFHQPAGGASQISFGGDTDVSPRKPTSLTEVAKQRELSGSQETVEDIHLRRPFSSAKAKELVGSNIFGPPPEVPPRSLNRNLEPKDEPKEVKGAEPAPRNVHTSVKVSNPAGGRSQILFGEETPERMARKVHTQKMAELSGNDIFKGDTPKTPAEKPVSVAKLREMSGSDIFADDKPAPRDCVGGIRKPPDMIAKMKEFKGSGAVFPNNDSGSYLGEKHPSESKLREISGSIDIYHGTDCLNEEGNLPAAFLGREKGTNKDIKVREIVGSDSFNPPQAAETVTDDVVPSVRKHNKTKVREICGSTPDILTYYEVAPRQAVGQSPNLPDKCVSDAKLRELTGGGNQIFGHYSTTA